jgi:tetratricopeptide (TPR) repeat protein
MYVSTTQRVLGSAAILLLTFLCGCTNSPQARRDKYLAEGKSLAAKKEYTRAILAFKNAAQAMPKDAEVYYQWGMTALASGDIRTGALSIKRAVELNPKHTQAKFKLAQLMAQGDINLAREAETSLNELRETAPATPEMLNTLAYTELRLGKRSDAVRILEEALAKNPGELTSSILLARARLGEKDVKGAEEVLRKAQTASPKSAQPHVVLGEFYNGINRPSDSEAEFRTALGIDPNNVEALYSLAAVQYAAGRLQDAEPTFKRLAEIDSPYKFTYALYLLRQNRRDEAVREFERLAKQYPDDRADRTRLVSAYQLVGRTADASKILEDALKRNPKDVDALVQRAQLLVASGKYEQAERDLNQTLRFQPDLAQVHYFLGKLHQARGRDLSYRQELAKALQLNPFLVNARLDLAQSLIAGKDPKGALDLLDRAPESQRTWVPLIVQRNWVYWAMGDLAQMRKGIDAGLAEQRSTDLLLQDGMWKLRSGNATGARSALEEALRIDPKDIRALSALEQTYETRKQTAEALQKVREYAARQPKSAPVQDFLGSLLLTRGDRAGARAAFEAAKAADPGAVQADFSLIQVDIGDGKLDDAQRRLQAILSADNTNTVAHLWMGNLKATKRDFKGAVEQYRAVVAADPNNSEALNNLAYLLVDQSDQPTEALKYAQKAKELAPNTPEYSDTLGWVYYHQGLFPLAVKELERATASGTSTTSEYHLAMAYAKAGDWNRGQQVLQAALKQNPNLPVAKLAQQVVADASPKKGNLNSSYQ